MYRKGRVYKRREEVKATLIKIKKHPDSSYIFCNKEGKPYGDIKKSFFTALNKSGIINFHFPDLRHTFASYLVMSGVDLNTVRKLLGYKTLDMTLRYSHLSPDHKQRAVNLLGQRIGAKFGTDLAQNQRIEETAPEFISHNLLHHRELIKI